MPQSASGVILGWYVYVTKEKEGKCRYPRETQMVAQISCMYSLIALSLGDFLND